MLESKNPNDMGDSQGESADTPLIKGMSGIRRVIESGDPTGVPGEAYLTGVRYAIQYLEKNPDIISVDYAHPSHLPANISILIRSKYGLLFGFLDTLRSYGIKGIKDSCYNARIQEKSL